MIYYVSQPYSQDPSEAFRKAIIYIKALRKAGYTPFSPILHSHHYTMFSDETWDDYIRWDLELLEEFRDCCLVLCPGWKSSEGCLIEKKFAEKLGIPIKRLEELVHGFE